MTTSIVSVLCLVLLFDSGFSSVEQLVDFKQDVLRFRDWLREKTIIQSMIEERTDDLDWEEFSLDEILNENLQVSEKLISDYITVNFNRLQGRCEDYERLSKMTVVTPKKTPEYVDGTLIPETQYEGINLTFSHRYRALISEKSTAVHLPVNVFDGAGLIKKDLLWTENVYSSFSQSWSNEKPYWQYIALKSGVFRLFPITPMHVDEVYDSRLEDWYITTATTPKTILLALDTSGSVEGMVLELIRQTSIHLLETLSDNDFVKVVAFNERVHDLKSCKKQKKQLGFVRATRRNVLAYQQLINSKLTAGYKASFEKLFSSAFTSFEKDNETQVYGSCARSSMIMTDGGEIDEHRIFNTAQAKRMKDMNVFTYGEGPEAYVMENMRQLACNHRGVYHEIPSLDAIRDQSLTYMNILSEPIALRYYKGYRLSEPNLQPWTKPYWLVLSLTCPIIGQQSSDSSAKTFVGVTGIDIPIAELNQRGVFSKAWPIVNLFMANEKGMILTHPILDSVTLLPIKRTVKVSLADILQFEDEETKRQFIKDVVTAGEKQITRKFASFKNIGLYAYKQNVTVAFKNSKTNTFLGPTPVGFSYSTKSGTAVADKYVFEPEILEEIKSFLRNMLANETSGVINLVKLNVANWPYCPNRINWVGAPQKELVESVLKVSEKVVKDGSSCDGINVRNFDTRLFQNLLASLYLVKQIADTPKDELYDSFGSLAEYLITFGGVSYISNEDLAQTHWWNVRKDPKTSQIYQRALALTVDLKSDSSDNFIFVSRILNFSYADLVHPDSLQSTQCVGVNVSTDEISEIYGIRQPVFINKVLFLNNLSGEASKVPYAVYGQITSLQGFETMFVEGSNLCSRTEQCYILDEGGFIISFSNSEGSSQYSYSGEHFAYRNPCFMAELVKVGIYSNHRYKDNYCSCVKITDPSKSPGNRVSVFTLPQISTQILTTVLNCVATFSISFWQHFVSTVFFPVVQVQEYEGPESHLPTPCSFAFNKYYYNNWPANSTVEPYFGSYTQCGLTDCYCELTRFYKAMRVPNTNLLVISSPYMTCTRCESQDSKFVTEHKIVEKAEYDMCEHEEIAVQKEPSKRNCPAISSDKRNYCGFSTPKQLSHTLFILTGFVCYILNA